MGRAVKSWKNARPAHAAYAPYAFRANKNPLSCLDKIDVDATLNNIAYIPLYYNIPAQDGISPE
jgi:hypothetical protein